MFSGNMARCFRVFASGGINRRRGDVGGGTRPAPHMAARQGAHPRHGVGTAPRCPPSSLLWTSRTCLGKIGTLQFVSSDSEDICRTAFLKQKTAENRNWHCGILLIG